MLCRLGLELDDKIKDDAHSSLLCSQHYQGITRETPEQKLQTTAGNGQNMKLQVEVKFTCKPNHKHFSIGLNSQ